MKNRPKLPTSVAISIDVGEYIAQFDGRKSRCSEVTMMTNRSNHMPTLTRIESDEERGDAASARVLNQSNCGTSTLQLTMIQ